ncbi:hypothetical protein ACKWTF_009973 [Chironomus riparius]
MKKYFILILFISCTKMFAHGLVKELIDQKVYQTIHQALLEDYPDQKVKTDCLIYYYKERKLTDEFYTFDIILNPSKVRSAVQKIVEEANFKCSFIQFVSSLFGISVIATTVISFCLVCTMSKKIYRKCCRKPEYVNVRELYYASNKNTEL